VLKEAWLTPDRTYMRKELLNTRAYAIFVDELQKQIGIVKDSISGSKAPTEQSCREAQAIFHNIKGGSGFFGLDKIYDCSAKLEKILAAAPGELLSEMKSIKKLIKNLEENSQKLPQPAQTAEESENA
jgi:chemotaxis protein histidine kinase CheA